MQEVRWRSQGHHLTATDALGILRFEVADINAIIKNAVQASVFYDGLLESGARASDEEVLPLSCFALTDEWTPESLASGTAYRSYRKVEARILLDAGFALWPTAIYDDNGPDPRNDVHFDLIVMAGRDLRLFEFVSSSKAQRAAARARVAPAFERVLSLMGEPLTLGEES